MMDEAANVKEILAECAPWSLADALHLVRWMSPTLEKNGWHVGLTGSVLINECSDNDVDLIVYPRKLRDTGVTTNERVALYNTLVGLGFVLRLNHHNLKAAWHATSLNERERDWKHVEVWTFAGPPLDERMRRVDIFTLRE